MSAFENRPSELSVELSSHFVNPMNQPWLSKIPILTLKDSYELKEKYCLETSFKKAVSSLSNIELANRMYADLDKFHKLGLDNLTPEMRSELISVYEKFDHPFANEIIDWLNDKYTVTRDVFLTQ